MYVLLRSQQDSGRVNGLKRKIKKKLTAVLTAAGESRRMGGTESKVLKNICGRPVIFYSLDALQECRLVDEIVVVCRESDIIYVGDIVKSFEISKVSRIVAGGASRSKSVGNAVAEIDSPDSDFVLIHDGARPCVQAGDIERLVQEAFRTGAAVLYTPSRDTLKKIENGRIIGSADRDSICRILTPQCFSLKLYREALKVSENNTVMEFTDDSSIVQYMGREVACVEGSSLNIKITVPEDLFLAEAILSLHRNKA